MSGLWILAASFSWRLAASQCTPTWNQYNALGCADNKTWLDPYGYGCDPLNLLIHIGGHPTYPGCIDRYGFAMIVGNVFEVFCNTTHRYKSSTNKFHINRSGGCFGVQLSSLEVPYRSFYSFGFDLLIFLYFVLAKWLHCPCALCLI